MKMDISTTANKNQDDETNKKKRRSWMSEKRSLLANERARIFSINYKRSKCENTHIIYLYTFSISKMRKWTGENSLALMLMPATATHRAWNKRDERRRKKQIQRKNVLSLSGVSSHFWVVRRFDFFRSFSFTRFGSSFLTFSKNENERIYRSRIDSDFVSLATRTFLSSSVPSFESRVNVCSLRCFLHAFRHF